MQSYLNIPNIERSTDEVEWHPLIPFLPDGMKVLFLGSFPPQRKRWSLNFYYPNYINDHWRIEGEVFFGDKEHFVDAAKRCFLLDDIVEHCQQRGIGFFDTATAIHRQQQNASDKYLEVVEPTDIRALIQDAHSLRAIVTTGEKATQTICDYYGLKTIPKVNESTILEGSLQLYRLPSSSRAYPLAFSKKVEAYRCMFEKYGIL